MDNRVIHINTSDLGGGAEEFALDLSKKLRYYLIVRYKRTEEENVIELPPLGIDVVYTFLRKIWFKIGFQSRFRVFLGLQDRWNFTYFRLRKLQAYREAEIVHLHNLHGGYFDLSCLKRVAQEKIIVWTMHDMAPFTGGEAATFGGKLYQKGLPDSGTDKFYPLNAPYFDRRKSVMSWKKSFFQDYAHKIHLIAPSKTHYKSFKKSFVYNSEIQAGVIYNGVNHNIFQYFERKDTTELTILFYNAKSPFKDTCLALRTIDKIEFPFVLNVIDKPFISKNPYHIIKNHGSIISREELAILMGQCDIFLFPSKAESFGQFPVEASSCGCYVLYNNLPVFKEHLELFQNGEICDNEKDFIDAINRISNDRTKYRQIGRRASETINQNFRRIDSIDEYLALYSRLNEEKKRE